jgi:hypothetical protein
LKDYFYAANGTVIVIDHAKNCTFHALPFFMLLLNMATGNDGITKVQIPCNNFQIPAFTDQDIH